MKKYLFSAAAILLLTASAAIAQQNEKNGDAKPLKENRRNNKKLNEYEEVIIKRKDPEKDTKVTIEIKDDEVFVDGKPIDEFVTIDKGKHNTLDSFKIFHDKLDSLLR